MAEAAALVAAAEVIETTVEVGVVAGYAVAKATLPLKASLSRIATTSQEGSSSLSRSGHTISIIDHNAYIFGGETANGTLAGNEIHVIRLPDKKVMEDKLEGQNWEYKAVPALANKEGDDAPVSRTDHTACVIDKKIYVFGGRGCSKEPLYESGRVWIYDTQSSRWSFLDPPSGLNSIFPTLYLHAADVHITSTSNTIIVIGGVLPDGKLNPGVWQFDVVAVTWRAVLAEGMPSLLNSQTMPLPPNMAIAHNRMYTITGKSALHSELHYLDLSKGPDSWNWETESFPSNSLAPGPRPRRGGGLIHISLGQGREYLLYFFGAKVGTSESASENKLAAEEYQEQPNQWSDVWAYQLPSQKNTSARLKDKIRVALPGGIESREGEWAEVEILTSEKTLSTDAATASNASAIGKAHPGPRAFFAASNVDSSRGGFGVKIGEKADRVVMWGGMDSSGERHGDGWEFEIVL